MSELSYDEAYSVKSIYIYIRFHKGLTLFLRKLLIATIHLSLSLL